MMHFCSQRKMIWSLCLIFSLSNSLPIIASSVRHLCRPDQRDALWDFKSEFYVQDFIYGKTERWRNKTDCCYWVGITCDPETGVVVQLALTNSYYLNGPLRSNSSLFRLQHLQSLDLTGHNLSGVLPDSIGNLKHLKVLRLIFCYLYGNIPSSLGNLSHLIELDLSNNDLTSELPDSMGNLNQLIELQLENNKFSGNFPPVLLNLSELTLINFGSNQFKGILPSNMSSLSKLEYVDIGVNSFSGFLPPSLFMIPSLIYLNLERNGFSGPLEIRNISSPSKLETLSLGGNSCNGSIPGFISNLFGISYLDLSFWNTEKGMVDFSMFLRLKSLEYLDLSYMNTRSMVDLRLFSYLTSLDYLDLSGSNLKISSTLHLSSSIQFLTLSSCNISEFPKFLQTQTNLSHLDLSSNQFEGHVPEWLWSIPVLKTVIISQNSFSGFEGSADVIQKSGELEMLDISSNTFKDPFPLLPKSLENFLASDNRFSGEIPWEICELVHIYTLVLSNNNFSGSIPHCFENFNNSLSVLNLRNNSFSGVFPEESISVRLISLDVGHNLLSGELPKSLLNCVELEFLKVEDNRFNDKFPFWLRFLPKLQILVLRSNEFHGPISSPGDSLSFPRLRIFDISKNLFTGGLPSDYFAGWSAMSSTANNTDISVGRRIEYDRNSVALTNKGLNMELVGSVFTMYKTIDVSENRLKGDIPESISLLKELIVLNMSNNAFAGRIPPTMGDLTNLQSLDLSVNRFSGKIPPELGNLMFLERMNFSYNRLEGPIPQGTQIQTQNSSSFAENLGLCGAPIQETCGGGEEEARKQEQEDEEEEEKDQVVSWIAAAIAYVPGVFCGFVISHILNSYRQDWFMRIFHSFA